MNRLIFAARNIADKLCKDFGNWELYRFYWQTYIAGRLEKVDPDVFIVSYPKSGRTWLRVMLTKYLDLLGANRSVYKDKSLLGTDDGPVIKFEHDQGNWVPAPISINRLSFRRKKYGGKKVVFLVRDPRDVLVSSWYHLKYRERIFHADLSAFIRDNLVGISKVVAFMNMWMENRHIPTAFLLVTYEQMHRDPAACFETILKFIGIEVSSELAGRAAAESSFEKMKRMERNGAMGDPWMKPGAGAMEDSLKVRKGVVGEYRREFTAGDIVFVDRVIEESLSPEFPYHSNDRKLNPDASGMKGI